MIAIVIVLVVLLMSAAFTLRFLYNRRKNLSKGLQHLSGESRWIIARGILILRTAENSAHKVGQFMILFCFPSNQSQVSLITAT